jgi:hypothetical protein
MAFWHNARMKIPKGFYLEEGAWWYERPSGVREQANVGSCEKCEGQYLKRSHQDRKFCSQRCSALANPKKHNWEGTPIRNTGGYMVLTLHPDHPFYKMGWKQANSRYVPEHRLVYAKFLGRSLRESETVHHINGDKTDNRIENLQLRNGHHGQGHRAVCNSCGSDDIDFLAL